MVMSASSGNRARVGVSAHNRSGIEVIQMTRGPTNPPTHPARHSRGNSDHDVEPWFDKLAALDANDPHRAQIRGGIMRLCLPLAEHVARRFTGAAKRSTTFTKSPVWGWCWLWTTSTLSFTVRPLIAALREHALREPPPSETHSGLASSLNTTTPTNAIERPGPQDPPRGHDHHRPQPDPEILDHSPPTAPPAKPRNSKRATRERHRSARPLN
jgi:hypothetical protein